MIYTEPAYAKLNLTLDILGKRPDGYHNMQMVMTSIDLQDTITLSVLDNPGLQVSTNLSFLPNNDQNLAAKAALHFFTTTGIAPSGLSIDIHKSIPVCAGMAGGSSDGAAVLRIMRRAFLPDMPQQQLEEIGALVGSDVPYCVRGGTALAEGRGEILTDLPPLPPCWFVVCKPNFPISTPELFAQVRAKKLRCHPDTTGMIAALEQGDLEGIAHRMYNVFEDILPRKYSLVFEIKRELLEYQALAASMTGSGPTVFGLFRDAETAQIAADALKEQFPATFICKNVQAFV